MSDVIPNHDLADAVMGATIQMLANLAARWRDESKYENFADYEAAMRKALTVPGCEFESGTKQPFGFKWRGPDGFRRHTFIKRGQLVTMRMKAVV